MDPVEAYLSEYAQVVQAMPQDAIWESINVLMSAWEREATIFTLGNGGSSSTASHMANDLGKMTVVEGKPRMRAICITDNVPLMTAWANDDSYEHAFSEPLKNLVRKGDVVVAISGSGNSPNVIEAVRVAKNASAITLGFTGRDGGQLKTEVDHCVCVPSDWIVQQEDGHLLLDHVIATTLRRLILER